MVIIKNNQNYAIEVEPKTVVDDKAVTLKIGKCETELSNDEVAELVQLLIFLHGGLEIRRCPLCGKVYTTGNYCSECGHRFSLD